MDNMCKKCISLLAVSLTLFGCTTEKTWDFQTDYFSIGINDKGYITSMKNTTVSPNREFSPADKPSPLLSLYDSEKKVYYTPQKAVYNAEADCFTLEYPNGSVATITLQPADKYFKLTLNSLEPRNGIDCRAKAFSAFKAK